MSVFVGGSVGLTGLATERLEAELCTVAGHLAAATCRWLLLVAEYDRRRGYEAWECVSMAKWLSVHVGMSVVTARQHVAVARRLVELPMVAEAFGRGEVSFSRVRALCRIATPATEAELLEMARWATAPQLERIVADTVRALQALRPDQEKIQAERRRISWWWDDDGMLHVSQVLPPEVGAAFVRRVQEATPSGPDELEQRRVDALAAVLAGSGAGRPVVVVHRYPDGTARLEDGPPIPASVADRLGRCQMLCVRGGSRM